MSQITDFFINGGTDNKGRTLESMLALTDYQFEAGHDFIQWVFPLHERSLHSPTSPVLTPQDIEELQASEQAQTNIKRCYERFKAFLGLDPKDERKQRTWCGNGNHNLLRVTRVIRCLRLFGLESEAQEFYNMVETLGKQRMLTPTTFEFWRKAMQNPETESLTDGFLKLRRIKV